MYPEYAKEKCQKSSYYSGSWFLRLAVSVLCAHLYRLLISGVVLSRFKYKLLIVDFAGKDGYIVGIGHVSSK